MCLWCHVFLCVLSAVPSLEAKETPERFRDNEYFLRKLFDKYGHEGRMTFEGFEHLLENLGLAQIVIRDHSLADHRPDGLSSGFVDRHAHHDHSPPVVGEAGAVKGHHYHEKHSHSHDGEKSELASPHDPRKGAQNVRVRRDLSGQEEAKAAESSNGTESSTANQVGAKTTKVAEVTFEKCLTATEILHTVDTSAETHVINLTDFLYLCPAIVYQLDQRHCSLPRADHHIHHHSEGEEEGTVDFKVWMYAFLGVLGISLSGLLSVAIVPLMKKVFYQTLIQFLVGLAVGSLTGDALLHLLPHAMSGHHHHHHSEEGGDGEQYVWHGLAALGGIYLFLIVERFLSIHSNHKHRKQSPRSTNSVQSNATPKKMRHPSLEEQSKAVGEKLSHHQHKKQDSYGFVDPAGMEALERLTAAPTEEMELSPLGDGGYVDIMDLHESEMNHHRHHRHHHHPAAGVDSVEVPVQPEEKDLLVIVKNGGSNVPSTGGVGGGKCPPSPPAQGEENHRHPLCHGSGEPPSGTDECHTETLVYRQTGEEHSFTLTVADHHHHHRHSHAHSHQVPQSIAAMAWMVIIGDGLHNFSDGLAIGAAFASGLSGGLSTTIAVFCHELPHELGDFAVLLKAGMSVRQAVFYNVVSSVLCLLGMAIGISLGNVHSASSWIFAGVGGMFLYIALVDMLPELSVNPSHGNKRAVHQLGIQLLGVSLGVSTMFVIALYERDLQRLMSP